MSHLVASLAWCWMQVLLVAGAAIGLSLLTVRRSPTAGATIAWSGVVAALALTGLAVVPLPRSAAPLVLGKLVVSQSHDQRTGNPKPDYRSEVERRGDETFIRAALNGPMFAKLLKSLRDSESAIAHHPSATRSALFVLAIGSAIGVLRLVGGLVAISALCRRSTVVSDDEASNLLQELLLRLPTHRFPQLRETKDLESAAVLGWWRPVVMLPAGWREWSKSELKVVLAHELAHIARHDALWRLVAAFAVVLHWGQPLVHWLRWQLLLAQELAADELAAVAVGSKQEYLRALAKLALRQDSRAGVTSGAALLPVFSGFLLKRILLLRAKDGSPCRDWRRLAQGSAVSLVVAVALLAAAIRGLAEPPDTERDGIIRVAKATDARPRIAAANNGVATSPLPLGWGGGRNPGYEVGLDQTIRHSGEASGFVKSKVASPQGFAGLVTAIEANEYRGKRLRLSAYLKTDNVEGSAQMWMRIDSESKTVGFDNMNDRPIQGTSDWKKAEIVLDVPAESLNIHWGFFLIGTGQVWADDFQLETVTRDIAPTKGSVYVKPFARKQSAIERSHPLNLDFEG